MRDLYTSFCPVCKKQTTQYAIKISRARGIKLKCVVCGKVKSRYVKVQNLTKFKLKESENVSKEK